MESRIFRSGGRRTRAEDRSQQLVCPTGGGRRAPSQSATGGSRLVVIRFVLFDLDNTLFDRNAAFESWAASFAESRGLGRPALDMLCEADEDGFASREALFRSARDRLALADSTEALIAEYRRDYIEFVQPDPSTLRALERLRARNIRVGIVTNGPSTQHQKIERLGLAPLVDGVCVSHEFGVEKPDPRIFQEAIRRCCGETAPAEAGWMVGDSGPHDIAGGHRVGTPTVWLSRGRTWTEPKYRPDLTASGAPDAVDQILQKTDAGD
jgi:putative hydrolase of the HAD superfamily